MNDHNQNEESDDARPPLSRDDILQQVATLPLWRHRITLPHGVVTPGREDGETELARLDLPSDLHGRRVLDVGCSDGFFSFECERRGAAVIGIDDFSSTPFSEGQSGFEIAKRVLNAKAEWRKQSVYELDPEKLGTFDLVLFLNTLYHLRHPLLGLEKIAAVLRPEGVMVLKTYFYRDVRIRGRGFDIFRRPIMRFFETDELNHDPSNWWAPNRTCLEAILGASGFTDLIKMGVYSDRIYYRCSKAD